MNKLINENDKMIAELLISDKFALKALIMIIRN